MLPCTGGFPAPRVAYPALPQDLDAVEFFAGDRALTLGLRRLRWNVVPYDLRFDANCMDFNSPSGFAPRP